MPKRFVDNPPDHRKRQRRLLLCCGFLLLSGIVHRPAAAQLLSSTEQVKADRLARAIYRRPRDGATFDLWHRIYAAHGAEARWVQAAKERAVANPADAAAQKVWGLVCEQQADWQTAAVAYQKATQLEPDDYYAWWRLGSTQTRLADLNAAAAAYEACLARNIPRVDRFPIVKQTAALLDRLQRQDQAVELWQSTAEEFSRDLDAQREIASRLQALHADAAALELWQRIRQNSEDGEDRFEARLQIAKLLLATGQEEQALTELAALLGDVDASSWRADELRSLVDQSLLRVAPDRVIPFWEQQSAQSPNDVDTRIHLAKTYQRLGREAEAFELYQETLRRAPHNEDALRGVISGLIRRDADEDAIGMMRSWVERQPDSVDRWLRLAELQLRHTQSDSMRRVADAIESWRRAMAIRSQDASLALQVAEHLRQTFGAFPAMDGPSAGQLREQLEACYREAVRREVTPATCRALGDFLHQQGRLEEAVSTWRMIAESGSPSEWRRVATILAASDQFDAAESAIQEALTIKSDDLATWQDWITLLQQQEKHAETVSTAERMSQQAPLDPVWQRTAAQLAIPGIVAQGQVDERIRGWEQGAKAQQASPYHRWLLAMLLDAGGDTDRALELYAELSRAHPDDEGTTRHYAHRLQAAGRKIEAIDQYQRLVEESTHVTADDYKRLAELQVAVEHGSAAKETLAKWSVAFPNDPEPYLLAAELATRANDHRQRIASLQNAVDAAPNDLISRRRLAEALHEAGQTELALAQIVSALETAATRPQKIALMTWCATWGDTSRVVRWLRPQLDARRLQDPQQYEDLTRCLVELLMQVGEQRDALNLMTELQLRDPSDMAITSEVVRLAQQADDLETAIRYQRQIVATDDRAEQQQKLARLLRQNAQPLAALEIWDRLLDRSPSADEAVATVEGLVDDGDYYRASQWVEAALSRFPDDPRLAYQAMLLHLANQRWEAARHSMREVLRNTEPSPVNQGHVADALDVLTRVVRLDSFYEDIDRRTQTYGAKHPRTMESVLRDELFDLGANQDGNAMFASAAIAWFRTQSVNQSELDAILAESDATGLPYVLGAAWVTGNVSRAGCVMEAIQERDSADVLAAIVRMFTRPISSDSLSLLRQDHELLTTSDPASADAFGWVVVGLATPAYQDAEFSRLMTDQLSRTSTWDGLADIATLVVHLSNESPDLAIRRPFLRQVDRIASAVSPGTLTRTASASIIDSTLELYAQDADVAVQALATLLPRYAQASASDNRVSKSPTRAALDRLRDALDRRVAISQGARGSQSNSPVRHIASLLNQNWEAILASTVESADRAIAQPQGEHGFPQPTAWLSREDIRRLDRISRVISGPHLDLILERLNDATNSLHREPAAEQAMQGFQIVLWERSEKLSRALQIAEHLVIDDPESTWAKLTRVELLIKLNRPTVAQQSLSAILVDQPDLPAAAALRRRLQRHWFDRLHWRDLKGHDGTVTAIAVDPMERWIASVGVDGTVRVWDVATGALVRSLQGHDDIVLDVAFSPDGRHLATGGYDQTIRRWQTDEWVALPVWDGFGATVRSVEFSPDRRQLVVGTDDGKLWLGNVQSDKRPQVSWLAHTRAVSAARFSPDGRRIISAGLDHRINFWELTDRQLVDKIDFTFSAIRAFDSIAEDRLLVAVGQDLTQLTRRDTAWERESHPMGSTIRALAVLPETGWWCLGSDDRSVQIWNAKQTATIATIAGHQGRVLSVVAAPSGRWFASAGFGGVIKLWRLDELVASSSQSAVDSPESDGSIRPKRP